MRERRQRGSIVTLLCDRGERYADTLFDPQWLARRGVDPRPNLAALRATIHA